VLQGAQERLVERLGLLVARARLGRLRLEALALLVGVVELRERVSRSLRR